MKFVQPQSQAATEKYFEYVSKDIKTLKDDLHQNFPTKEDLVRSNQDLLKEISQSKVDMIKWMFGFWITPVLLILASWFFKR